MTTTLFTVLQHSEAHDVVVFNHEGVRRIFRYCAQNESWLPTRLTPLGLLEKNRRADVPFDEWLEGRRVLGFTKPLREVYDLYPRVADLDIAATIDPLGTERPNRAVPFITSAGFKLLGSRTLRDSGLQFRLPQDLAQFRGVTGLRRHMSIR